MPWPHIIEGSAGPLTWELFNAINQDLGGLFGEKKPGDEFSMSGSLVELTMSKHNAVEATAMKILMSTTDIVQLSQMDAFRFRISTDAKSVFQYNKFVQQKLKQLELHTHQLLKKNALPSFTYVLQKEMEALKADLKKVTEAYLYGSSFSIHHGSKTIASNSTNNPTNNPATMKQMNEALVEVYAPMVAHQLQNKSLLWQVYMQKQLMCWYGAAHGRVINTDQNKVLIPNTFFTLNDNSYLSYPEHTVNFDVYRRTAYRVVYPGGAEWLHVSNDETKDYVVHEVEEDYEFFLLDTPDARSLFQEDINNFVLFLWWLMGVDPAHSDSVIEPDDGGSPVSTMEDDIKVLQEWAFGEPPPAYPPQ